MKTLYTFLVASSLWVSCHSAVFAQDIAAGETLFNSKGCIGCHGPKGQSANEASFPTLAGKEASYIADQIKAFRDYERENPMMNPMVQGISDEQAAQIGAYLAAQ
ncbi:Cytochrome c subfamily [gamma proteobacterium HTCC5015]|nr:Cytochrome c subfamily [gamma proteobacterium HTCC5015]